MASCRSELNAARVVSPGGHRLLMAGLVAAAAFLATRSAAAIPCQSPCVQSGDKVMLALYWSNTNVDNATMASGASRAEAQTAGYVFVRNEAMVFKDYKPGLVPLHLYFGRTDFYTTATVNGLNDASDAHYLFRRLEGWVYATQQPGTVPLYLYWNATRNDNFVTASAQGIADAKAAGYDPIRVEGYVFPAP
jgi:hypothetical protein